MSDIIEEIKSHIDIVSFLSSYVQLKKTGRNFKGVCPFHSEKTPSFIVSPEKQIWHCFGCNKGGDIFKFVQEADGVGFSEALQILADRAGLKIEKFEKFKKKDGKSEKDEYFEAHEIACSFFEKQLYDTKEGERVLKYLKNRGLKDETIKNFRLGFAPDSYDSLHPYLLKKGVKKDVILKSGFASQKSIGDDKIFDKNRLRLMIPIYDYLGRICGFGGRALKDDQQPKYLNSPDNIIYNKSRTMYGLSHAKQYIKENDQIILVEGYFDMILPFQAGVKNIAATSGTALTNDHVKIIKRLTNNVVTCFDTDSAGFEATKRAYFLLQNEDMNVKTVWQLDKKDPADYVADHGEKFKELIIKAKDFVSFYIDKLSQNSDSAKIEGRKKIMKEILPVFKNMPSTSKDYYVRYCSKVMNIPEASLYDDIDRYKLPFDHPAREISLTDVRAGNFKISVADIIIGILLEYPKTMAEVCELLSENDFVDEAKNIYIDLFKQYNSSRSQFKKWNFDSGYLAEASDKVNILLLYTEDKYNEFSEEAILVELKKLIDKLKKDCKSAKLKELEKKIKEAEMCGEKDYLIKLLKEQQNLLSK